ncbi:MAG: hypothetical protein RIQ79_2390, partial [Verrucomicrobiota bacterium]
MKTISRPLPINASSRRGSVLLVALIFAGAIALALGSLISLTNQASQYSYRTFYIGSAMNAAETGLEQAMWAINKRVASSSFNWESNGWTYNGVAAQQTVTLPDASGAASVSVKVYVSNYKLEGTNRFALARSIVTPKRGKPIERWIKIGLSPRADNTMGLVAEKELNFVGNGVTVDSYDSRNGLYNTNFVNKSGVSELNKYARGNAGSASINESTAVKIQNGNIYGTALVGYSDAARIKAAVGSNGIIGDFSTASGTVDLNHVQSNFTTNFKDEPHPAAYTATGSYNLASMTGVVTLPRPATAASGKGS